MECGLEQGFSEIGKIALYIDGNQQGCSRHNSRISLKLRIFQHIPRLFCNEEIVHAEVDAAQKHENQDNCLHCPAIGRRTGI